MTDIKDILGIGEISSEIGAKLIDNISKAIGFYFDNSDYIARKRLNHEIMKEVSQDTTMSPFVRAAAISNWNTITREHKNKTDIVIKAINLLDEKKPIQLLDKDWLVYFFEKAKNVSDEEMQIIWGKILADESQESGKFSKLLLNSLSMTEGYQAKCFEKICQYQLETDLYGKIIILPVRDHIKSLKDFELDILEELDDLGYIRLSQMGTLTLPENNLNGKYDNKKVSITGEFAVQTGQVEWTRIGEILSNLINISTNENFFAMLQEYYEKDGYKVSIS